VTEKKIPVEAMLTAGKAGDKQFIKNPSKWPNWPFLPLRKRDDGQHFPFRVGLLIESNEPNWQSTVYVDGNLFNLELTKTEKKVYASVDEMLNDGWEID